MNESIKLSHTKKGKGEFFMSKITGFSNLLKQAGLQIKSMKKTFIGSDGKCFDVIFKDGRKGQYSVMKNNQGLRQRINVGTTEVMYDTVTKFNPRGTEIFSKKLNSYIEMPQRISFGTIHEPGKFTYAELTKTTPFANHPVIMENGSYKQTVSNMVEQHSDKLLGRSIIMTSDSLTGPQGQHLKIYQRNPYMAQEVNVDKLLNTYY